MYLFERAGSNGERQLVVDCDHATTEIVVADFARPDPARGSAYYQALIKQHRKTVDADPDSESCECKVLFKAPAGVN